LTDRDDKKAFAERRLTAVALVAAVTLILGLNYTSAAAPAKAATVAVTAAQ
jgi:hypothetical protein